MACDCFLTTSLLQVVCKLLQVVYKLLQVVYKLWQVVYKLWQVVYKLWQVDGQNLLLLLLFEQVVTGLQMTSVLTSCDKSIKLTNCNMFVPV